MALIWIYLIALIRYFQLASLKRPSHWNEWYFDSHWSTALKSHTLYPFFIVKKPYTLPVHGLSPRPLKSSSPYCYCKLFARIIASYGTCCLFSPFVFNWYQCHFSTLFRCLVLHLVIMERLCQCLQVLFYIPRYLL